MRYRLLYMLLLLLAPQVMTAQNYEYWLDNDYAGRVSKYGELGEVSFEVDVSMLNPGIHYLNCRGRQQKSVTSGNSYDAWGTIKRTMFYVIDTKNSEQPIRVEYWLDSDYAGRVSEATSGGAVAIEKNLSELTSGIHYLNVRSLGAAGQWGTIKRTMFYVDHSVKSFANVRCWIDDAPATAVTQKVEGGTVSLSIDVSELNAGDHTLYVQGMGSDGDYADIRSFAFQNSTDINEPANQRISLQDVPFRSYTGWGADAQVVGTADCAWVLNEPTDMPYGDGSVINRADLSHFSKLRVVATEGAPRFLLNRDMDEGQWSEDENESHLIEYPKEGWSEKYFTKETTADGDVYTVDLKQIKNDKGFVYLHAIKGANWADVTVSSMEVELDGDPQVSIAVNGEGTVGWSTPTGVGEVGISNPSELITTGFDSELNLTFTPNTGYHLLHVFVNDVNDYVNQVTGNSLTLHITQDTNIRVVFEMDTNKVPLTADDFYKWDGWGPLAQIIDQGECQYVLGEPAEIPYGDPEVKDYVDLSSYSRLEVTVEEGSPRFLFNRECENGLWLNDETESHLIEYPKDGWTSRYFSQNGNVWSVDLKQMVADKGFAHLHAIKAPWDSQITVTKMELVANDDIVLPEAYAVLSEGNTVLTFYYDVNKSSHDGAMSVGPFSSGGARGWDSNASNITKVEFDKSFANCLTLTSTANWFAGCDHLTTINGTRRIKTADVAEMWCMFLGCSSLTSLDLSSFNTTKLSAMQQMFFGCSALTTVYVGSGWNLDNMSYEEAVFEGCTSLVGGYGTAYDASSIDYTYARIDEGSSNPGYFTGREPLTHEMMFVWDGVGAGSQKTALAASAYSLGKSMEMPYGEYTGSDATIYADLSSYSRIEVLVTAGSPRFLFNRDETDGQPSENEAESHLIDSDHEGCMTWASKYFTSKTTEGGTLWSVNLKQMVEDKGFAHLHAIKGAGDSNITVTKMELFVARNTAFEPEPYAVLSDSNTVLTFYYDKKKEERNGMSVGPFAHENEREWNSNAADITSLVFDESFAEYHPTSTAMWFQRCSNLKSITNIQYLKTDSVTSMEGMFTGCSALESIDLSNFNTEKVTSMYAMFSGCSSLTSLDLSKFNTANVTETTAMFSSCSSLTSLDLSNFNTFNVTNMPSMFAYCTGLKSLDLSGFRFNSTTSLNLRFMFRECSALQTIYVDENWTFPSGVHGSSVFDGCTSLVGGMGTKFDESHTDYTYAHIDGGPDNPGYFTDINSGVTIYVQASEAPYLYAFDADGTALNGEFPGNVMADTAMVNGQTFWKTRIYRPVPFNINILDADWYRTREIYVISDRYFVYEGTSKYIDVTNRYAKAPEIQISSLALPGNHNDWNKAQMFTETEPGKKYTMEVDLTNVTIEDDNNLFQFKLYANACAWLGITSLTLDAPSYVRGMGNPELIASDRNIVIDLNSTPTRKFLFEATWNGGYQMEEGWTLKISEIAVPHYTYDSTTGVLTISGGTTVAEALEAAGGSSAAVTLTSIIWDNPTPLTNSDLQGLDNPNMLIYVSNASLAPERNNVVVGNDSTGYTAMNIVLTDVEEGNNDFYCPIAFVADMISYTHEYRQQTEIGVARGWETIAMPFTVQTIMHEKNGLIAPFGNDASTKHFWLRQLTQQGLARAIQIEANTPYLISMPNNDAYPAGLNLAGRVTFSSQQTLVPVTQANGMEAPTATGGMVMIQPNFKRQSAMDMIYTLNVGVPRGDRPEGSVFEANYRSVRPFEAFTVHHGDGPAPQFISITDINNGGATGIEDVISPMSDGRGENCYDLQGRKIVNGKSVNGKLPHGVYIRNGKKTVVR